MGETNLPAEVWLVVAMIAALTVTMCLSVVAATIRYERVRRNLAGEVHELRKRFSLSYSDVIMPVDEISDMGADREAA